MKLLFNWHQIAEYSEYELKVISSRWVLVRRISDHFVPSISDTGDGYKLVGLKGDDGKWHTVGVHVLVCLVYKGPRPKGKKGKTVNHIDGCKWNNHPSNLEWMSQKGNVVHAWKMGLNTVYPQKGESNGRAKLTWVKVRRIRSLYSTGRYTQKELSEVFATAENNIWGILSNRNWKE